MCGLLLRIFLEPSPYLPRTFPVATPLLLRSYYVPSDLFPSFRRKQKARSEKRAGFLLYVKNISSSDMNP